MTAGFECDRTAVPGRGAAASGRPDSPGEGRTPKRTALASIILVGLTGLAMAGPVAAASLGGAGMEPPRLIGPERPSGSEVDDLPPAWDPAGLHSEDPNPFSGGPLFPDTPIADQPDGAGAATAPGPAPF